MSTRDDQAVPEPSQPAPREIRRVAIASYIGTTLEWYDYFAYTRSDPHSTRTADQGGG